MDEHRIPHHDGQPVGEFGLCGKPNRCSMSMLVLKRVAPRNPRLQETILATRKVSEAEPCNAEKWNKNLLAMEKLVTEIEADQNPVPVLSIEQFICKKGQS